MPSLINAKCTLIGIFAILIVVIIWQLAINFKKEFEASKVPLVSSHHGMKITLNGLKLSLRPIKYTDSKTECEAYQKLDVYPSILGFESCQMFETLQQPQTKYNRNSNVAICKSSSSSSSSKYKAAAFLLSEPFGKLGCPLQSNSTFKCQSLPSNEAVCDCNYNCSEESLLLNVPISAKVKSRKVLSFSLFGNNSENYCKLLRQVRLSKLFYPQWMARVYLNQSLPNQIITMFENEAEVVKISQDSPLSNYGSFWRLLAADDLSVDIYCTTNGDVHFNHDQFVVASQWLNSSKNFTLIRDRPVDKRHLMRGLWCGRKQLPNITAEILAYKTSVPRGSDQDFLMDKVWPLISKSLIIHESDTLSSKPFCLL